MLVDSFRKASSIADCTNVFANTDRSWTILILKKSSSLIISFFFKLTGFNFVSLSNGLVVSCMGLITDFSCVADDARFGTGGGIVL